MAVVIRDIKPKARAVEESAPEEPVKVQPVEEPVKKTSAEEGEDAPKKPVRRAPVIVKNVQKKPEPIDTAKAVAFAMSIAKEMKRTAKAAVDKPEENKIQLSERPTSRGKGSSVTFPDEDLQEFRQSLLAAREAALSGVDAMRATGFNESEDREADGGDGTNQTLRLQALGQMGSINRTIQQIEEALHRIEDGTYGVCTVCGQLIRKPRLVNQPFVLTCMECQSAMEKDQVR